MSYHENWEELNKKFLSVNDMFLRAMMLKRLMERGDSKTEFGSPVNVLVTTDRLPEAAQGLQQYLKYSKDITVDYAERTVVETMFEKPYDFLIIVGSFQNNTPLDVAYTPGIINAFKTLNKFSCAILYTSLDSQALKDCVKYGIHHKYDISLPIDGMILYMKEIYDLETLRMHKTVSPKATREKLWKEAIA